MRPTLKERNTNMTFYPKKWYVVREGEGLIGGPYGTKREAKNTCIEVLMERTTKCSVYPSLYNAGYGKLIATGKALELAGYGYLFNAE